MQKLAMTELRQNLPNYLGRVSKGERFQITVRGKIVARLEPEQNEAESALQRLIALRSQSVVGDLFVENEIEWSGDSDHL